MRVRLVAAGVGFLTGAWALGGSLFDGISRGCPSPSGMPCPPAGVWSIYVVGLALLLILNSLVCLVGPSIVFYGSATLSVLLGASMTLNSSFGNPVVLLAFALVAATFLLSLVAARRKTAISEQSNPMNLPVFG